MSNAFSKRPEPDPEAKKPPVKASKSSLGMKKGPKTFPKAVPWGLAGAMLVVAGGMVLGEAVGVAAVGVWLLAQGQTADITSVLAIIDENLSMMFVMYLLSQLVLAAFVLAYVYRRGGSLRELGFRPAGVGRVFTTVLAGFIGFLLLAVLATVVVEYAFPQIDVTQEQQIPFTAASGTLEIVLAFMALVVIAPVIEEMVFRGLLLPAAAKAFGVPVAVVATSVLFGLLHPPAIAMVTIGIFGLFLSWAYIRGLSLWPAIILHSVKNLIAFIAIIGVGL